MLSFINWFVWIYSNRRSVPSRALCKRWRALTITRSVSTPISLVCNSQLIGIFALDDVIDCRRASFRDNLSALVMLLPPSFPPSLLPSFPSSLLPSSFSSLGETKEGRPFLSRPNPYSTGNIKHSIIYIFIYIFIYKYIKKRRRNPTVTIG